MFAEAARHVYRRPKPDFKGIYGRKYFHHLRIYWGSKLYSKDPVDHQIVARLKLGEAYN